MNMASDLMQTARINMVESQIRPNRVYNVRVLETMLNLPREDFVPAQLRGVAYLDEKLKLAPGRYLLEPLTTARLFEAANLEWDHEVLIVGAGTGYGAALAGKTVCHVYAVEEHNELRAEATRLMEKFHYGNVEVVDNLNRNGYEAGGPYDVIIVEGAMSEIPAGLMAQLKEGGRLIGILAPSHLIGGRQAPAVVVAENLHGQISTRPVFDAVAPYLPGFEPVESFRFAS
jgi:protein-L-isoaspartate(D-aspartate) O-methyltransferase